MSAFFFRLTDSKAKSSILLILLCLALYLPGLSRLPPFDRDEARYAQASKQMLESGDYTRIFFQDVPRHKKPVGIYWLQTASVRLFDHKLTRQILYFRLPSVLAAVLSVLIFYSFAIKFCERFVALTGAVILASTTTLVAEAHLATTDAALLLCAVCSLTPLISVWIRRPAALPLNGFFLFWCGLGAGVLIKGPVLPGVLILSAAALSIFKRSGKWLLALRPLPGALLALLIVLPWLLNIQSQTGGAFLRDSFAGDILPKFAGVHESHGGFPGYYALGTIVSFWPWSFLLVPAAIYAYRQRKDDLPAALLCWLVPSWVVLEFVPTRLPHYSLPLFPPLALLCALTLSSPGKQGTRLFTSVAARINLGLWMLVTIALAVALPGMPLYFDGDLPLIGLAGCLFIVILLATFIRSFRQESPYAPCGIAFMTGLCTFVMIFGLMLPGLRNFWAGKRLSQIVQTSHLPPTAQIITAGFSEPSFVFLSGTTTKLSRGAQAAELFNAHCPAIALVTEPERWAFERAVSAASPAEPPHRVFNYSKGKWLWIYPFIRTDCLKN